MPENTLFIPKKIELQKILEKKLNYSYLTINIRDNESP